MSPQNDNLQFKSISDLNQLYDKSHVVKRKHFKLNQWMFYSDEILDLKEKLDGNSVKFSELKGIFINRGVTTGANKIFIIDEKIKDELLNRDPNSIDLIKPILKGADIKRYYNKTASNWIIFTRRGTKIDNYPAIKDYLSGFKDDLTPGIGRKKGSYKWFEIQDNTAFYKEFEKRKIIWTRLSNINTFSISEDKEFTLDSSSFATHENSDYLCGVLNSKVVLFYFKLGAVIWGKDGIKWFGEFFDSIPIPHASDYKREEIGEIVKKILEIKKSSPNADIINYEKQIDQLVYELYGLTEDEIGIVEGSCI
jgi:hypothetical protein